MESGVGPGAVELRLVTVQHEVLYVSHLVVYGLQICLVHLCAHLNSAVTKSNYMHQLQPRELLLLGPCQKLANPNQELTSSPKHVTSGQT